MVRQGQAAVHGMPVQVLAALFQSQLFANAP